MKRTIRILALSIALTSPACGGGSSAAPKISLAHAGSTYRGTIDNRGQFTTPPANYPFPDADYTIGLTGLFSTTGFTATVDLTKRAGSTTCTYAVSWVGTKQGSPNSDSPAC